MQPSKDKKTSSQNALLRPEESGQDRPEDFSFAADYNRQQVKTNNYRLDLVESLQVKQVTNIKKASQSSLSQRPKFSHQLAKSFPREFSGCMNIVPPRSQMCANRQLMPEPQSNQSQQDLYYFEWKYRTALNFLKTEIQKNMGSALQDQYKQMLKFFEQFRQHLIMSIKAKKQYLLTQKSKLRETQRKRFEEKMKIAQKKKDQAKQRYSQSVKQLQDALKRNDPQKKIFKDCMQSILKEHNIYKEDVDRLERSLRRLEEEAAKEKQQIERVFAQQLEQKLRTLDKQREEHEKVQKIIEKGVKENLRRVAENQSSQSSKQPSLQQEFLQRLSSLEENIRSNKFNTKLVQNQLKDLKAFYMTIKENLIDTINTQEKLQAAEKQLDNVRKKLLSIAQKYSDCYQTKSANKEENMIRIFEKLFDDLSSTVKELKVKLDTLDKNAKRKKRLSLGELQSMLERLEGYKDFHVDLEKRILQREQLFAQLEEARRQRNWLLDQRKRILENVRSAQEQELPKEEIGRLKATAKELEEKLKGLDQATTKIQEGFKKL